MGILRSAFSHYDTTENLENVGDAVAVFSFGTSIDQGSVNAELAQTGLLLAGERPLLVDSMIYKALWLSSLVSDVETVHEVDTSETLESQPLDHITVLDAAISSLPGRGGGSWEALKGAKQIMADHGIEELDLIIVGQAYHVGRVAMQAKTLEINPLMPANLTRRFDRKSKQLWTRGLGLWVPYELLGSLELKRRGQL